MIFRQIESGGDRNFSYLVASQKTREAALIDPAPDTGKVIKTAKREGVQLRYIINTHFHHDHLQDDDLILKNFNYTPVKFINSSEKDKAKEGQVLMLGEIVLRLIKTPGHTPESICISVQNKLMTGDTLFVGKVGGTYNQKDAQEEYKSLKRLMEFPDMTEIWPGHDYGTSPSSTIGDEKKNNPFIRRLGDFESFLWLKENWVRYKKEHGIR